MRQHQITGGVGGAAPSAHEHHHHQHQHHHPVLHHPPHYFRRQHGRGAGGGGMKSHHYHDHDDHLHHHHHSRRPHHPAGPARRTEGDNVNLGGEERSRMSSSSRLDGMREASSYPLQSPGQGPVPSPSTLSSPSSTAATAGSSNSSISSYNSTSSSSPSFTPHQRIPCKAAQLDVPHIDTYLLSLLLPRFLDMFRYLPKPSTTTTHFMSLLSTWFDRHGETIFRILLHSFTLWFTLLPNIDKHTTTSSHTGGATPAMSSLGLRVTPTPTSTTSSSTATTFRNTDHRQQHSIETRRKRSCVVYLILCSVVLPQLYNYLLQSRYFYDDEDESTGQRDDDNNVGNTSNNVASTSSTTTSTTTITTTSMLELARRRRKLVLRTILSIAQKSIPLFRLYNYLAFLLHPTFSSRDSSYSTSPSASSSSPSPPPPPPSLAMRLAGLSYGINSTTRDESNYSSRTASSSSTTATTNIGEEANPSRSINFTYAYRRLLYEESIRTMLAWLPLFTSTAAATTTTTAGAGAGADGVSLNTGHIENNVVVGGGGGGGDHLPANGTNPGGTIVNADNLSLYMSEISSRLNAFVTGMFRRRRRQRNTTIANNENRNGDDGVATSLNNGITCAICSTDRVCIPYVSTSCGHTFCYICLRNAVIDDPQYRCKKCRKVVSSSRRVSSPFDLTAHEIQ